MRGGSYSGPILATVQEQDFDLPAPQEVDLSAENSLSFQSLGRQRGWRAAISRPDGSFPSTAAVSRLPFQSVNLGLSTARVTAALTEVCCRSRFFKFCFVSF